MLFVEFRGNLIPFPFLIKPCTQVAPITDWGGRVYARSDHDPGESMSILIPKVLVI